MSTYSFEPIGRIHSCFKEKFGIPRQPGLVPEAEASLEILPPYNRETAFKGLEDFSHIWILFVFHKCRPSSRPETVRPPRLGGNRRIGVFASRSGFRPNPIGQSVVPLAGIRSGPNRLELLLTGVDLLDGTPVLDVKPYLPYADCVPAATGGFAGDRPDAALRVDFSADAAACCHQLQKEHYPKLEKLIRRLLALDPRPAYHDGKTIKELYGMRLWDLNIQFRVKDSGILVETVSPGGP